jgi:fatty-acyl-CoA synthase
MRHSWFAPSTEPIDAEDVLGHCRGKVASFKLPRHVVFVDAFPMTVSGKIRKTELRGDSRKRFEEGAS